MTLKASFVPSKSVCTEHPAKGVAEMREEAIRPDHLMRINAKLHAHDVQELLTYKKEFVEIVCPACEHRNYRYTFLKNGFTFVICKNCETMFINPRPTFEKLLEFYVKSKSIRHWNDHIFPASEDSKRIEIFAPRALKVTELVRKFKVPTGVLIDIGAGFGTFCEEIKKLNIFDKVVAVEPSSYLAETCRLKGLEVIAKPVEQLNFVGKVSVITNFELIEHLYSPKRFLLSCASLLSKGGLFILSTPNIKGFDLLILGKLSNNVAGPNHLNYFHSQSIKHLLRSCKFEVLEILTPGKLDVELVRKKILEGKLNVRRQPFLKQILLDRYDSVGDKFQSFLSENRLSSHMWIVARKIL